MEDMAKEGWGGGGGGDQERNISKMCENCMNNMAKGTDEIRKYL